MSSASPLQELRSLLSVLQKAVDVPPPAVVTRQPPPPLSSLPDMRIALAPLDQATLWTEYNMYRNKNQHKHAIYFHRLTETKKLLAKWKTLKLRATVAHLFNDFNTTRTPMVAPSRPHVALTIARLRICRIMISSLLRVIQRAYIAIRQVLAQRFFVAVSVLCMAMLSRFHTELITVDEVLSSLTDRLAAFLPYCASPPTSESLTLLLSELEPLAAKAPPPRVPSKPISLTNSPTARAVSGPVDLGERVQRPTDEAKRPLEAINEAPSSQPKKLKSPQPATAASASPAQLRSPPPFSSRSPMSTPSAASKPMTPAAQKPGTPVARTTPSMVGVTPPFVRTAQSTPTSVSFWTPSPSRSPAAVSPSPYAASPSVSPSMRPKPVGTHQLHLKKAAGQR